MSTVRKRSIRNWLRQPSRFRVHGKRNDEAVTDDDNNDAKELCCLLYPNTCRSCDKEQWKDGADRCCKDEPSEEDDCCYRDNKKKDRGPCDIYDCIPTCQLKNYDRCCKPTNDCCVTLHKDEYDGKARATITSSSKLFTLPTSCSTSGDTIAKTIYHNTACGSTVTSSKTDLAKHTKCKLKTSRQCCSNMHKNGRLTSLQNGTIIDNDANGVECMDFFAPQASIAGSIPIPTFTSAVFEIMDRSFIGIFGSALPEDIFTAGNIPTTPDIPTGTVVATAGVFSCVLINQQANGGGGDNINNSTSNVNQDDNAVHSMLPIVFDSKTQSFLVCKEGAYQITYYLQGVIQISCPRGITFGIFANGELIPQSVVTVTTTAIFIGNAFNVTKKFCVNLPTMMPAENVCLFSPCEEQARTRLQIRVIDADDPEVLNCLGFLANATIEDPTAEEGGTTVLGPSGTLLPNNAFEIVFDRLGDMTADVTCARKKSCGTCMAHSICK